MPFVPVPDTLLVEVVYEQADQVIENTMYFERTGGWDLTAVQAWLDALNTLIQSDLLPLLHSSLRLVRLVGTVLDAVDALSYTLTVSPSVPGSEGGVALPNGTAYVVTFQTAGRGRSNRGRNYVPGIAANNTATANQVDNDFRTGIMAYYDAVRALAASEEIAMVVVSRFSGVDGDGKPIPRTTGVTTPVTGIATFDDVLDSQRRRLPGRGA